jgi:alpha-D-xyloside xylohydrolase
MMLTPVNQPNWSQVPSLTLSGDVSVDHDVMCSETSAGPLRISFCSAGVRLRLGGDVTDYGIVCGDVTPMPMTLVHDGALIRLTCGDMELLLHAAPFSFSFRKAGRLIQSSPTDAHFVRQFRLPPFARMGEGWFVSLELDHETSVYGLGEKWGRLDKRGQILRSYNQDALGVNAEHSYKNTPFAWSPDGWSVFAHTAAPVTHGVGYAPWSQRAYGLWVEQGPLDLFIFAGDTGADHLKHYTDLTGRAAAPPLWSLGVILSKAYYKDADEILSVAREVRARKMPCDVITFDGRAWQDTDTRFAFEWCPKRYPDPKPVIDALKAMDFKICVWEYPLISVNNKLFNDLAEKGWLIKDARTGEAYRYSWDLEPFGPVLTPLPESGLLDFTHPDAFAFWRDKHKDLYDLGVDMIKPDFGEQIDQNMIAYNGAQGDALHNIYALLYNRCVYEAAEKFSKSGAFLFSRAAWAGQQKYPGQWGGDPQADWGGLAASIRGSLSWGMSGGPFFATDIGGFYRDQRDPVLYVRWLQMAIFAAHIRLHGIGRREPWSYGETAEKPAMAALRLRYQLIPYLQKCIDQSCATGLPVQRAMALAFPNERPAWGYEHQFMLGDDLLVVPCLNARGDVAFYLPQGQWQHLLTGDVLEGGRTHAVTLALDSMAVYFRVGTPVELGPVAEHIGQLG